MSTRMQLLELPHHWSPPEGLDRSAPRPVSLTANGKGVLALAFFLGIAAATAGSILGAVASRQAEEFRLLRREGILAEGTITRLWRSRSEDKQPWIAYRFSSGGVLHDHNSKVPFSEWKNLRVGATIPIRYLPSRPELNDPVDFPERPMPPWIPYIVAVSLAAGSFLATLPIRAQRRLLAGGRPAPALVTQHRKERHGSHGRDLGKKYDYEFPILSGAIAKGHAGPIKNPPAIGSTISVLYDPEEPRKNAPYPFTLVRLTPLPRD